MVTEAHVCEQLGQGCHLAVDRPGVEAAISPSLVRHRLYPRRPPRNFNPLPILPGPLSRLYSSADFAKSITLTVVSPLEASQVCRSCSRRCLGYLFSLLILSNPLLWPWFRPSRHLVACPFHCLELLDCCLVLHWCRCPV